MKKFVYKIFWSEDDYDYTATCEQFPSLSWLASSPGDALDGLISLIKLTLEKILKKIKNSRIRRDISSTSVLC